MRKIAGFAEVLYRAKHGEISMQKINERLFVWEKKDAHFIKVLTNEKRGGLKVVSFDRSRFKRAQA
jgi:hypothetical protein